MKPTLLVLAAGMGSRYGGLKQIDPVGPSGEIIIDYSVFDAIQSGFGKVVFIIRRDIEKDFKESIGSRFEGIIPVEYAYQELDKLPEGFSIPEGRTKPWGTGHAILMAKELINEPFAVINADDFYGTSGFKLLGEHLSKQTDMTTGDFSMVGFILKNTLSDFGSVSRGICECDANNKLVAVVETTKIERDGAAAKSFNEDGTTNSLTAEEIVSMNMWGFTPYIFTLLEEQFDDFLKTQGKEMKSEFFIPTVVDNAINKGQATVDVLKSNDSWFGITYQEDRPHVVSSIKQLVVDGKYPEKLFNN